MRDYRQVGHEPLHRRLHARQQHGRHVRKPGHDGHERLPERRHRCGEVALALSVRDDIRVRLLVLSASLRVHAVQRVCDKLRPLLLRVARGQRGVERVLLRRAVRERGVVRVNRRLVSRQRNALLHRSLARPVDRVGERASHLTDLRRLVRGLGQSFQRQRVSERRVHAARDVRPVAQRLRVLAAQREQVVHRLHRLVCLS